MNINKDITDLIGNTPLLALNRYHAEAPNKLLAKLELLNPISVKDRPVLSMINQAEKDGKIKPGGTIVEATSGNTGMAIASICSIRGYKAVLCMSEKYSIERRQVLKALGAELVLTPAEKGTVGAKEAASKIAVERGAFYIQQHHNQANWPAHYYGTAEEIWKDTDGKVDVFVAGLGTGGTITGTGKRLKELNPDIKVIAIEPDIAPYIKEGKWAPHMIMGTSPGFLPEVLQKEVIDDIQLVSEENAFSACREIAEKEGLLVGISSGAVAHTMKQLSLQPEYSSKVIVGIFADTGQRYLSVNGLFKT